MKMFSDFRFDLSKFINDNAWTEAEYKAFGKGKFTPRSYELNTEKVGISIIERNVGINPNEDFVREDLLMKRKGG